VVASWCWLASVRSDGSGLLMGLGRLVASAVCDSSAAAARAARASLAIGLVFGDGIKLVVVLELVIRRVACRAAVARGFVWFGERPEKEHCCRSERVGRWSHARRSFTRRPGFAERRYTLGCRSQRVGSSSHVTSVGSHRTFQSTVARVASLFANREGEERFLSLLKQSKSLCDARSLREFQLLGH
jgi:hypothetical protein